jgi:hypothetical protein
MPAEIVTQTCPAPECNLSQEDVERFLDEMTKYMKRFEPAFQRVEQLKRSKVYVHGLLGNARRKNVEQMALGLGEKVRSQQYFVGQSPWEAEPVIGIHQQLIGETLGEEDGVALIDESSAVKQGDGSVGVARQYCGSVGKVANGQVGVYLGYASRKGYSLVEGQLFMPDEWFACASAAGTGEADHAEQRKACGVPEDLEYKTKPEIGLELLQKTRYFALFLGGGGRIVRGFARFSRRSGRFEEVVFHRDQEYDPDLAHPTQSVCAQMEGAWSSSHPLAFALFEPTPGSG